MKKLSILSAILLAAPAVAFAQTPTDLRSLIAFVGNILNALIPLLIALTLVVFFYGLYKYALNPGGGGGKEGGGNTKLLWGGLVALFIMVSVWGIIRIAQNTFGVNNSAPITIPQVPQAVH
ncbi:MAG: hypothetical protein KGI70_00265 [Patescibacteria group bacterium]|nr:hypothetical protein [Patescibacteria group bacterium]